MTRAKTAVHNNKEAITDESDVFHTYDSWEELKYGEKIEPTDVSIAISIRECLDAQKVYPFRNEILSGNGR